MTFSPLSGVTNENYAEICKLMFKGDDHKNNNK